MNSKKLTLIKSVDVYTPESIGIKDVLFCGNQILTINENVELQSEQVNVNIVNGDGKVLIPGLIDPLVHITGGGGEGGFNTRTPEMQLTEATLAGVTTVIGALGTDDVSRTLEDLLAKAQGLEAEGLNVFCHTGSYQVPVQTVVGSIRKDIMLIPQIIGVGELAIADHRSSHPTVHEFVRVASDARVGGMLSGKKGTLFLHVGDDAQQLNLIFEACETSAIPASQFYATHINRNESLLNEGIKLANLGGYIDVTTSTTQQFIDEGEILASAAVKRVLDAGAPPTSITMSSDGNASLPQFSADGEFAGLEVGRVSSLYHSFVELTQEHGLELSMATQIVTGNPAEALGLKRKGHISVDHDADLVLLNKHDLSIDSVWSKGLQMVKNGEPLVKGLFEDLI
ncbi:MAG: beta-aspartyl-peptidase [Gammaproteobacteria bacterium]|nr:beta-aspartyl-peptidase [Gammaproteobacteria bacterium]